MSDFFPAENYPGIFATHQWVDAWEKSWSDSELITQLHPHVDKNNCRDGFYTHQSISRFGVKLTTLFSSGVSTPACQSIRSEYFNLQESAIEHFLHSALLHDWDQLYIPDIILSSQDYYQFKKAAKQKNLNIIERDRSTSYAVQLRDRSFEKYLQSLGGNSRLKLFNKRKNLYAMGDVCITNLWPNFDEFVEVLNRFHLQRWGKVCYSGRNLKQMSYFINEIAKVGGVPDLSIIYCNGQPVSAVFDLSYKGRIYNIQSGYQEKFHKGISLGTLHFGFQLEKAFRSGAIFYDFMAGQGKNNDYKKSISTHSETLVSVMIVRKFPLKFLYSLNDFIRHR